MQIKKPLLLTALIMLVVAVTGCNTFKGFGQDVQKAGEKIEGAASK
jgi:predicted small secreted protein